MVLPDDGVMSKVQVVGVWALAYLSLTPELHNLKPARCLGGAGNLTGDTCHFASDIFELQQGDQP